MTVLVWDATTPRMRRWALVSALLITLGALGNAIVTPTIGHALFAAGFPVQIVGAGLAREPKRPWLYALGAAVTASGASVDARLAPSLAHVLMAVGFAGLAIVAALEAWRVRRGA